MRYYVRGPWGPSMHRQMWEAAHCGQAEAEKDLTLAVDVLETAEAYVVLAALPGMKSEDLNIEITGNQLKLQGSLPEESEENVEWLLRERGSGKISRTLQFRDELDAGKAEASLKDGLLRLRLPKVEEALPKTVKVTAA
jgi:HSP20 family protein